MILALLVFAALSAAPPAAPAVPVEAPEADRIAPVAIRIVPAAAVPRDGRGRTELVCRSTLETGSLILRRKACLTRRQWSYVDDAQQDAARRLVATAVGGVGQ